MNMKRAALLLQLLSLMLCAMALARMHGFLPFSAVDWLLPSETGSESALWLAIVFGISITLTLLLPLSFSGRDELLFGSGFGVCLAVLLIGTVGTPGLLQCMASFALGSYAKLAHGLKKETRHTA